MVQILGEEQVLFFPSSFRRAIKYGQRDAANEVLRTEVLNKLSKKGNLPYVITYPEAVAEQVISRRALNERTLDIVKDGHYDLTRLSKALADFGFQRVDYVYEPGQFAVRGSILDVFSFSCELPYRIDFFGDEVDSIRTFDVQNQLSIEKKTSISILPELNDESQEKISLFSFLPKDTVLALRDFVFVHDCIDAVYAAGFSARCISPAQWRRSFHSHRPPPGCAWALGAS